MTVLLVVDGIFESKTGGSGFVRRIAPFPAFERSELLTILIAETLANTLAPHARLKGED